MKAITTKAVAMIAKVEALKKKTDLLIIRITNLKTYSTLESIIISMA
jgi:hypothetical protein